MCEEMIKNPYRRVWACVNLDALHDNLRQIAACRKNDAGIIAVIKAIVCCPIHPAKVLTMEKEPLVAMVIMAMP